MSPSNLMAETVSCQEESTCRGEVSSKGGEGERGRTGGGSRESSWLESEMTSEPEGRTLEIIQIHVLLLPSSLPVRRGISKT